MTILVLGSEGFIGHHCVQYFISAGHSVAGADLFEQPTLEYPYTKVTRLSPDFDELFRSGHFDAVINAAGSGNVPYSMTHPVADFESNCLDTIRVLDTIRKHQPGCSYIHLSSAAVYGNPTRLPISENEITQPLSAYGFHKLIAEQLCQEYSNMYGVKTAIVRPFSVYGPGLKKQLYWDLYQKASHANGSIELFGTGKESRDYIHVRDLVHGIECILKKGKIQGEIYNLASGIETTIEDAVGIFMQALPNPPAWHFNGKVREGDPLNWRADIARISQLGFTPAHDLTSGLHETAGWIRSLQH